jgi:hypothetical protein
MRALREWAGFRPQTTHKRGTGGRVMTSPIRCLLLAHQFMGSFYFGWACSGPSSVTPPETFGISGVRDEKYSWVHPNTPSDGLPAWA